jgi:hypothetical protein
LHRRNRAHLKRIGLLALAMVLALGTMGIAYSAWTEELYINSTVQLGNVDIDVAGVSSTFAYKVPGAPDTGYGPETVVHYLYGSTDPFPPAGGTLIASAVTVPNLLADADEVTMTFTDIFPCIDFQTDVELEYVGTIPVVISAAEITPIGGSSEALDALWALGETTKDAPVRTGAWFDGALSVDDGTSWTYLGAPIGMELQQGEMAHITLHVHLPEGSEYANLSGLGFTGVITVVQFNAYEEP